MTQVILGENESIDSALRRFKRQVSKAGIFPEIRRLRHFETPTGLTQLAHIFSAMAVNSQESIVQKLRFFDP